MFNRPLSYVNIAPLSGVNQCEALVYPKIISDTKTNLPLTLRQIADRDLQFAYFQEQYDAANVTLRDASSDEICLFALETVDRIEGTWTATTRYIELEDMRKDFYRTNPKMRLHPTINRDPDTSLADIFYKIYPHFID